MNEGMPVSKSQALIGKEWLMSNFGGVITQQNRYSPELISAIFCQETLERVQLWFDDYTPDEILSCCIFDASGDFPGTTRSAFPKNAAAFHDKYGDEFTDMLISEGNKMRRMPQPGYPQGYSASHYLYKGYGLFQMDLQAVILDEGFFKNKLWYNFGDCFSRLLVELDSKKAISGSEWEMVKHYNGSGQNAENYANNVMQFKSFFS